MEWSEELSSGLLQAAPDAIVVTDADGRIVLVNAQAEELFGYPGTELVGRPVEVLVPHSARERHPDHRRVYVSGPHPRPMGEGALPALRADGREFPAEIALSSVTTGQGQFVVAVVRDVTERHRAAQAQALLASIVQSSHDAIISMTLDREVLSWNPGAERLYGYTADEMLGGSADVLVPPARRQIDLDAIRLVGAGGRLERYRTERVRKDGTLIKVWLTLSPLRDPSGAIAGVTSTARDFSERERAEAQFKALLEAAPDALVGVQGDSVIVLANQQVERSFGYQRAELLGQSIEVIMPAGLPQPGQPSSGQLHARRRDGTMFPVDVARSVLATDDGPVTCVAIRDISERLRAEAEQSRLQAEADRQRVEAQTHRAQRLESLGQLAGGVAHDFNNLLGVILNYAAFVLDEAGAEKPDLDAIASDAQQILRAGQRGTELTHQLLAFARREVVRPQVLDLNEAIIEVEQMLRRSLGEHIDLSTRLSPDLRSVTADPGQLEQVLVNLAVNARDAMPAGGQLTIDTGMVRVDADFAAARPGLEPGEYVRLRVSDSGTGMPPEVVERAFEPFFTTKSSGEGTGLGLATVYGIVTQAGGSVMISSEQGLGTTVTILLPATDAAAERVEQVGAAPSTGGRGETVLVVEDEAALREVTSRILCAAGYQVLAASDGAAALELARNHDGDIDLLVSDVVMPGMLGKELAERLGSVRPGLPVLYMSGYAQPVLASQGTLDPGVVLLEKPFTKEELLGAVRHRLDAD